MDGHGQYGSYGYEGVGYEVGSHGRRVYGDASFNNDDGGDGHGSSGMFYMCSSFQFETRLMFIIHLV